MKEYSQTHDDRCDLSKHFVFLNQEFLLQLLFQYALGKKYIYLSIQKEL